MTNGTFLEEFSYLFGPTLSFTLVAISLVFFCAFLHSWLTFCEYLFIGVLVANLSKTFLTLKP